MNDFVHRVMALWDDGEASEEDTLEAFRTVYTDPVRVNGTDVPLPEMAGRALAIRETFTERHTVIHDLVEGDRFVAFAFDIQARHVGPGFGISASVEPSEGPVVIHGMDIFHLDGDGKVTELWAVSDQSDLLGGSRLFQSSPR